jgi:hypothetical protein
MHLGGLEALALPLGLLMLYPSMTTKIHTLTSGWTKSSFDFQKQKRFKHSMHTYMFIIHSIPRCYHTFLIVIEQCFLQEHKV